MMHFLYRTLFDDGAPSRARDYFESFILTLIVLNVLAVMLETVGTIHARYGGALRLFDVFSVMVFTIEYVARVAVCTRDPRYNGAIRGRLRYMVSFFAIVDLLAILPFYLPMFVSLDLRSLRALRLFRLFRILKMARYSSSLAIMGRVMVRSREELISTLFAALILLIVAASLMYYVENRAQPESFSSIPAAMWWGVATLTTVGYGDMYPVTPLGRMIASVMAIIAIGTFALPAGILGSGFMEEIQAAREKRQTGHTCPHCGKDIGRGE